MIFKTQPEGFKKYADVVACYVENDGKFVLLQRNPQKSFGKKWGLPAGKVEEGETLLQAVQREIQEETGLQIPENDFVYFDTVFVRHEDRDFEYHMFSTKSAEKPDIQINTSEHIDFAWVSPQEALTMDLVPDQDECVRLFYG